MTKWITPLDWRSTVEKNEGFLCSDDWWGVPEIFTSLSESHTDWWHMSCTWLSLVRWIKVWTKRNVVKSEKDFLSWTHATGVFKMAIKDLTSQSLNTVSWYPLLLMVSTFYFDPCASDRCHMTTMWRLLYESPTAFVWHYNMIDPEIPGTPHRPVEPMRPLECLP